MKAYDIVAGKIADDRTNITITTYRVGGYGTIGSELADKACISQLIPERLRDQYCFRTNEALGCISFVESEKIWIS
jgi:transcriptional antiterminator